MQDDAPERVEVSGVEETPDEAQSPFDHRGTFVVVDEHGAEHAAEDGILEAMVDGCSPISVEVKGGRFRDPDFAARERFRVDGGRLGGKPVVCDVDLALDPSNPPLHLRGRWLAPVRVYVVDGETGAPVTNVSLGERGRDFMIRDRDWLHPGEIFEADPSVVAGAPVLVWPRPGKVRKYFVGAPGYAWARIDLDPAVTVERWVRLDRAGDIDLAIQGTWPYGTVVRVSREEGGSPIAEWPPVSGDVTRIKAVPAGSWYVAVAKGLWFQHPLVLGRARVEVTPGNVASAAITLRDAEEPTFTVMAGTLVYSSMWRIPPVIEIEPTGATRAWTDTQSASPKRLEGRDNEYSWGARRCAGTYQLRVAGSEFRTRVELPPTGDENVRIVVPEPSEIRLRVLDADTGELLAVANEWQGPRFELEYGEWEGSRRSERFFLQADGSYLGQSPPGVVSIRLLFDGYASSRTRHEVVPGTNDFVVSAQREYGVAITLKDGDATVPWPEDLVASLTDASGRRVNLYRAYPDANVAAKAPGELTLTVPDVAGFAPIQPRSVTVTRGAWTEILIPLQRRR